MTGLPHPTAAEIAQRENAAAAGFALNEIARTRVIVTGTPDAPTQAALEDMVHHAADAIRTATSIVERYEAAGRDTQGFTEK